MSVGFLYNSADIADRIRLIAKSKNIVVSKMLNEIGLGRNAMANLKTSMPKSDSLAKIADYLDCSVDYLLGRTEIQKEKPTEINGEPSIDDKLLAAFMSMSTKERDEMLNYMKFIISNRK